MTQSASTPPNPDEFIPFSARLMAAIRAKETARPDRLFNDTYAAQLAGEKAFAVLAEQLQGDDRHYVAVRTRFFDDFLLDVNHQAQQIVILASGMDTRAYRLPWSAETVVYELDQAPVLTTKKSILGEVKPNCQHKAIAADLTQPWSHLYIGTGISTQLTLSLVTRRIIDVSY